MAGDRFIFWRRPPEDLFLSMPFDMTLDPPKPWGGEFIIPMRYGGMDLSAGYSSIIQIDDWQPTWPGVAGMLEDGWVACGGTPSRLVVNPETLTWHDAPAFVRTKPPGELGAWRTDDDHGRAVLVDGAFFDGEIWPAQDGPPMARLVKLDGQTFEREGGVIDARRVLAGRYARRLPTNRKRKRARCKERRSP